MQYICILNKSFADQKLTGISSYINLKYSLMAFKQYKLNEEFGIKLNLHSVVG